LQGQVFVFFVIVVAAAEAAVGLAIIIVIARNRERSTSNAWIRSNTDARARLSLDLPLLPLLAPRQRHFWPWLDEKRRYARGAFLDNARVLAALELVREFAALPADQIPWTKSYFTWISAGGFRADFALQVDQLTIIMLLVVTGVGWLIHIYSTGYMHDDPGYRRFFSYLNLFMFFMLLLVLAANYLLMFVGWEGVGCAATAHRIFLPEAIRHQRRQQSFLGKPHWRLRFYSRTSFDPADVRHS